MTESITNNFQRPIILASKSPRRRQLLEQAGISFTIRAKSVEEDYPEDLDVRLVPAYLSEKKAKACADFLEGDAILLSADSIVLLEHKIYGKPQNEADAFQIIKALSGKMHEVITGVTLLSLTKIHTFSEVSKVFFKPLSDAEIHYYIEQYQPFDKAGAYAIQEWIGLTKVSKIDGCYYNIMGLPVHRVYEELLAF